MTNTPEFNGNCAFAVSTGKKDVKSGKSFAVIDGKTYMFSNPVAKILFKLLPGRVQKANKVWNK